MEKNHLIDGKNIFPSSLKINKKINIGIVGSGKIAHEYIKVIKSFNHNILVIVTPSKNLGAKKLGFKYKIPICYNFEDSYKKFHKIDAWIICTKWDKLKKYLFFFLKQKKPVLIEKSININSSSLNKICKNNNNNISNIVIAYNRNYYDYISYLVKKIKSKKLNFIEANIHDPYDKIIKKNGNKIKHYLPYFISSHWVALILKILKLSNIKIIKIKKTIISKSIKGDLVNLDFILKQGQEKILLKYNHLPNFPQNHSIKFYFKNEVVELSPIETLKIHKQLKFIRNKNHNFYKLLTDNYFVKTNFKPGFRYLYFDFINHAIFKKRSKIVTNLKELIAIYRVCEAIKNK